MTEPSRPEPGPPFPSARPLYSVTKRIEFCYGHRLLEHAGLCKHLHGHNAVAEIEVRSSVLDGQDMVCDFGDITDVVQTWVDRHLDHKMILRWDDPLVEALTGLGEPVLVVEANPTAEHVAKLIFDKARASGLAVSRVTVWETPSSSASYTADSG